MFERVSYLSGATAWDLLRETFPEASLPGRKLASLDEVVFWPTWSAASEKLGQRVEPDVALRFSVGEPARTVALIVEAKLGSLQNRDQWAREWIAHAAEVAGAEPDECWLLALGGMRLGNRARASAFASQIEDGFNVKVNAATAGWADLLAATGRIEAAGAEARILEDIRKALALFGFRAVRRPLRELVAVRAGLCGRFEEVARRLQSWLGTAELESEESDRGRAQEADDGGGLASWALQTVRFRPIRNEGLVFRNLGRRG